MSRKKLKSNIAKEIIISKIYYVRGRQIMLSHDLAGLYEVETKVLNQQVKRNIRKFPDRFMFQLTWDEYDLLRSQNVTLKRGQYIKYPPYAFTEHGVLMLSSVLKSEKADEVNILIIDTFVRLREILHIKKDLKSELNLDKIAVSTNEKNIKSIFDYLKQFEQAKQKEMDFQQRRKIGYK